MDTNIKAPLYLYLSKEEFSFPWIHGGEVPIFNSVKYLSLERSSILTIDEGFIQSAHTLSEGGLKKLEETIVGGVNVFAGNVILSSEESIEGYIRTEEHGLIVCMSKTCSEELCKKLEKVVCLEIGNPADLFHKLTNQLRLKGVFEDCKYVETTERGPFTKSSKDSWQDEVRFYWSSKLDDAKVQIPKGTGVIKFKV